MLSLNIALVFKLYKADISNLFTLEGQMCHHIQSHGSQLKAKQSSKFIVLSLNRMKFVHIKYNCAKIIIIIKHKKIQNCLLKKLNIY